MRQGSFVRKGVAPAADPGTRPGLHGQTLVSSGHPDLDRLLGGGLPLGSLLLLLEDSWSGHHATLLRYFLAEGAACGQSLLLAAAPPPAGGLPKFIPAQLKLKPGDKDEEGAGEQEEFKLRIAWQYRRYIKTGQQGSSHHSLTGSGLGSSSGSGSTRLGGAAGSSSMGGSRGSSSSSGSGSSSSSGSGAARKPVGLKDWCHQFDLLKSVGEEGLQQCRTQLVDCGSGIGGGGGGAASSQGLLLAAATEFVQSLSAAQAQQQQAGGPSSNTATALEAAAAAVAAPRSLVAQAGARAAPLPPRGPQFVGRIAVLSLGSIGWQQACQPGDDAITSSGSGSSSGSVASSSQATGGTTGGPAVLRCLLQLKALVRDRRCAAVVSVPGALFSPSDVARMQHIADGVIALESVADNSDIARLAPDPASVAGLLHLRKLPALGTLAQPVPDVALHLIRHKRRKLAITPVEIDPDAEVADAEAASGAGKSVASLLCGGPAKADNAVDF